MNSVYKFLIIIVSIWCVFLSVITLVLLVYMDTSEGDYTYRTPSTGNGMPMIEPFDPGYIDEYPEACSDIDFDAYADESCNSSTREVF